MRPQELNSVTSVTEDADASAIEGSDASAIEGSEGGQERGMLEKTARELAEQHSLARLVPGGRHDARRRDAKRVFMKRLQQQELLLERAYDVFLSASREELGLSYAAEWYLDNYYLLQRAQHLVQEDFPAHYYDELPKLANDGPLAGFPRIYDIARRLVVIERCEVDEERIRRFLDEYQQIQPLRIGELWALPIMLRVVLLEAIVQSAMSQTAAGRSPGRVEEAATPPALRVAIDLRDEDVVASCVPTLHALAHQDWKDFFESVSLVEQTLAEDPAQIYSLMDFDTRDRYRKAVEKLAAGSNSEEIAVAQQAVALAEQHGYATDSHAPDGVPAPGLGQTPDGSQWHGLRLPREAHVGYYLVDTGRSQLERQLGYKPHFATRLKELLLARPTFVYLGSITFVVLLLLLIGALYLIAADAPLLSTVLTLLLLLVPAVSVATSLVNWALTQTLAPRVLPKLDFSEGVPDGCRAMIVIPSMLGDETEVDSLLRQLEGHYLRNPDANFLFALLTDFTDAEQQVVTTDRAILDTATQGIDALNRNYRRASFYLFHRRRVWNEREGVWMGWERKRGKLHELNRLLRGAEDTTFHAQIGDMSLVPHVRYVITLDADTVLPRESAATLVGTLAHPLNQAQFDTATGKGDSLRHRVVAGYTILQPRTEIQPDWGRQSLFTRVFAGDTGLDLYSLAVSDVYHDLFGEGIYVGKGIYDVDAFERSLHGAIPDDTLLSHDLFEGIHGRAALVTDVILYEDYPPHYLLQVHRSHRWVRGDWQLLPWLLPFVPTVDGWRRNRLELIDLWKIADNLRRSLLSPLLLLLLIAGWTVLPGSALVWTLAALFTPAATLLTSVASSLVRFVAGGRVDVVRQLRDGLVRWLLYIAFLPYEAILNVDAIVTTLVRVLVTRRNLLQWTTASHTARLFGDDISLDLAWRKMLSSFLLSTILGLLLLLVNPDALRVALPLLILWSLSPELAYFISRPETPPVTDVTDEQRMRLRRLARRTWFFFERFVGPDDNWLPPDHFQEDPKGVVAHRTSPTNIGLYLLSVIAAYDFGYIDPMTLMLRLRSTFNSLEHVERYRGHFINWIDTITFAPLPPRYVSTVDSGNLAACLIALQQALADLPQRPTWRWARWQGLLDTIGLLVETVPGGISDQRLHTFRQYLQELQQRIRSTRDTPEQWPALLDEVASEWLPQLEGHLITFLEEAAGSISPDVLQDCRLFMERAADHLQNMKREMNLLVPWLAPMSDPPSLFGRSDLSPELARAWQSVRAAFPHMPVLRDVAAMESAGRRALDDLRALLARTDSAPDESGWELEQARDWAAQLDKRLEPGRWMAQSIVVGCVDMKQQAESYVQEMDFRFLFNRQRQVFHIGYNLDAGKLDDNYYDLLASEARIASLIAIAKHDVPFSHWLHLSRPVTSAQGRRTLLSWSGTMFEYLMPPLLLRSYDAALLNSSALNAIHHQIAYGAEHAIPWGVSESGFYTFDAAMNYQYQAFGVPGLGFRRGLGEDTVVTPYASLLALPFRPNAVLANMDRLDALGMMGRYGYYEAVDFTESRLALGKSEAIVCSYMAHHQGMILLALLNFLEEGKMVRRFHADPRVQSVELLLQEQVPLAAPLETPQREDAEAQPQPRARVPTHAWRVPLQTPMPAVHHLSNGRYSVLITNAGAGFSRWEDVSLTRWRPDTTLDDWGQWFYLKDEESGALWSAGVQPMGVYPGEGAELLFHPHKVEWRRRDHDIVLHAEIHVAPDDAVEIRRIRLSNDGDRRRLLRLTSYAEVVLTEQGTDQRHQAFAKLFVESDYMPQYDALLFCRRRRSHDEKPMFMAHMLVAEGAFEDSVRYEGERLNFLGRNNSARRPQVLDGVSWLSGTTGATLDPIMSLGRQIELEPYSTIELALITVAAESRREIETLLERYRSWSMLDRVVELARARAEYELQRIDLGSPSLELGQQLLSLLFYPHPARRAASSTLSANQRGQPGLWAYGISGDFPILLLRLRDEAESALLNELLRIHGYWYSRGLKIALVVLNDQQSNYGQVLQNFIFRAIRRAGAADRLQRRGGIFVISTDQIGDDERLLLQAAARVNLDGAQGSLSQQLAGIYDQPTRLPALEPTMAPQEELSELSRPGGLLFDNGFGGFSPGAEDHTPGREYVIYLRPGQATPAPWINVIANPDFGFLVSESGAGFTWSENSGENRLTTWRNDPVADQPSEALYLRDEETAAVWSPTPQPAPAAAPYLIRHGAGYTIFEHQSHNLRQEVRLFVAAQAPVKIVQVQLKNLSQRQRRLTATYYAEWVLGTGREITQQYLIPEYVGDCNALLVRNPYNVEFGQRVAFLATGREPHGVTADRIEFLGRLGSLQRPAALQRVGLENAVRAGFDTCGAMQLHVDLAPGATETVYFVLGQGGSREQALQILGRFQEADQVSAAWDQVHDLWENILQTVQVDTPDPAMNLLLNRWLLYQALSCRVWGRSALYQSSGAYGFRDQLQDVMALVHACPQLAREHILRAARHQFEDGDVLHWWHPPSGRGVRTRISDDLLWLPFVTAHYVAATGDTAILEEQLPFLKGKLLGEDEEERYGHYAHTTETFSLLDHCVRALYKGMTVGENGLPLIGAGDWNDGMNRVGIEGQGESVWLGWFLYAVLQDFADLCEQIDQSEYAMTFRERAEAYRQALDFNAWDGEWYRRAYYDDGSPLGSRQSNECQIDAIAQSWSVLSGAGDAERRTEAMAAVERRLIDWDDRLLLLFTPPFDQTRKDPGYIKGYPPGIRENGGQYTHAAIWTIWAFAEMGQGEKAEALFRLANPIYHAETQEMALNYRVEPYVIAADVYGVEPHTGRGGWTWYTGSSGWMYRLGVEAILGVRRQGNALRIKPAIPAHWPGYSLIYRFGGATYHIKVLNAGEQGQNAVVTLDGERLADGLIPLRDDGREHIVQVRLAA